MTGWVILVYEPEYDYEMWVGYHAQYGFHTSSDLSKTTPFASQEEAKNLAMTGDKVLSVQEAYQIALLKAL